jgi:hypothetical protein
MPFWAAGRYPSVPAEAQVQPFEICRLSSAATAMLPNDTSARPSSSSCITVVGGKDDFRFRQRGAQRALLSSEKGKITSMFYHKNILRKSCMFLVEISACKNTGKII